MKDIAREVNFAIFLFTKHGLTIDDVEVTDTKGYWKRKKFCGGLGVCRESIHSCIGNEGPIQHTIYYVERYSSVKRGRFVSPYTTWQYYYDKKLEGESVNSER